jgi:hypothetical protein
MNSNENLNEDAVGGSVLNVPLYCGDCLLFTGEECNGNKHEGSERYFDSTACDEFEDK